MDSLGFDNFRSVEEIYNAIGTGSYRETKASFLLLIQNWYIQQCTFDPRTGQPMPKQLQILLRNISNFNLESIPKDRLDHIIEHTTDALIRVLTNLRNRIEREHAIVPLHMAREFDSSCVIWLSSKPGRNTREKLSNKPYIKAVKRKFSINTIENRLIKAFMHRLEEVLSAKAEAFPTLNETHIHMQYLIEKWLHDEEIKQIGKWSNLPPNNTLLQDRNYRRIWDSWIWLQNLDDDIMQDQARCLVNCKHILFWSVFSRLNELAQIRFPEQPCFFDFSLLKISPALNALGVCYDLDKNDEVLPESKRLVQIDFDDNYNFHLTIGDKSLYVETLLNSDQLTVCFDGSTVTVSPNASFGQEVAALVIDRVVKNWDMSPLKKDMSFQQSDLKSNSVVIDLCSLKPRYSTDSITNNLNFPLLRQYWDVDKETIYLDLGNNCDAVVIGQKVITVSILDVFWNNRETPSRLLNEAAIFFCNKIANCINATYLTYLVPDALDDFALERIRKNVNYKFRNAKPLPRSIAALYSWQSIEKRSDYNVGPGDCVLIIESSLKFVSITPLVCCQWDTSDLKKRVPESKGLYWERHPSKISDRLPTSEKMGEEILEKTGCNFSSELSKICGFEGIIDLGNKVSWVDDKGEWYTFSGVKSMDQKRLKESIDVPWDELKDAINGLRLAKNAKVFVIPIGGVLEKLNPHQVPLPFLWVKLPRPETEGGRVLNNWQARAGDIPLWKDHLPDLAIRVIKDGNYHKFDLVKQFTVSPLRDRKIPIPVQELFVLPSGPRVYEFPLIQGSAEKELRYVAYLKSNAFPLRNDVTCRLDLKYTYGNDDPYELLFIPVDQDKAGFKSARVEWIDKSVQVGIPEFPKYNWSDMENFPNNKGGYSNLLDWVKTNIDNLISYRDFIKKKSSDSKRRVSGVIIKEWSSGLNGKYCFVKCPDIDEDIYCNAKSFAIENDVNECHKGSTLSFVIGGSPYYYTKDVSLGYSIPYNAASKIRNWRFPVLTIFREGRSFNDPEAPEWFKNIVRSGVEASVDLIELSKEKGTPNEVKNLADEAFRFLCCLHKNVLISCSKTS